MPDPNTFESRLADAMRRYSDRAPTDVDAMALAREIASAPAEEARRHPRWWPFGQNERAQERSRTMFIATGAAMALSIALAGGGLALLISDSEQDTSPAVTPEITLPPLEVRVSKAHTSGNGYALGQPTDVVFDLGMSLDPADPGRTLKAGDSIRITLPEEFMSSGLPADVPSACDVAAGACNTGFLLQGWPDSYLPTTEDYYTLEMDGSHTFVFTATQDLVPSAGAPGIKQIHLLAPGFTNPEVMTEYLVQIEAETGADGTLETDTASFVPTDWYGMELTSAFAGPGEGAAHANTEYQQARVGESPEWPWDFLVWNPTGQGWRGDITLRPLLEYTGYTVPEGPTILETGGFHNGMSELGAWWIEGPEGATGATATSEPVEDVESPISGETVSRLRIHFTAGDLPGRYTFHYGYSEGDQLYVDVNE